MTMSVSRSHVPDVDRAGVRVSPDWMQLATSRLVLREHVPEDAAALHRFESRDEHVRYLPFEALTPEAARARIDEVIAAATVEPRLVIDLAITVRGSDAMIGRVGLRRQATELRTAFVWYSLDPAAGGRGYATEAIRALVEHAFRELRLHRIHAEIDPRNVASIKVAERLGMRREAHLLQDVWIKGEWCSTLIYAVLASEWPRAEPPRDA